MKSVKSKGIPKLKRSLASYLDSKLALRSKSSKKGSKFALDSFSEFLRNFHQTTPDEVIDSFKDNQVAIDILQAWINWFSTTKKKNGSREYIPNAVTTIQYFHAIKSYLHYMGIKFHPYDIKQEISLPKPLEKSKHGITIDEIKLILDSCKFEKKAMYLAQISSGMRIGELLQIKKKNLDFTNEKIMVRIPAEFTKLRRERVSFFSKEFDRFYRSKLNKLDDNDLLFGTNEDWEKARDNEIQNMSNLLERIGLKDITTHSFRSYLITRLSRKDPNFAKLLAGQKGYLLQYDRMSESEKLERYLEFENELLINEHKDTVNDNDVDTKREIESVKRQIHEQQLTTLRLIGDAIKDPEKFKKMLLEKQKENP